MVRITLKNSINHAQDAVNRVCVYKLVRDKAEQVDGWERNGPPSALAEAGRCGKGECTRGECVSVRPSVRKTRGQAFLSASASTQVKTPASWTPPTVSNAAANVRLRGRRGDKAPGGSSSGCAFLNTRVLRNATPGIALPRPSPTFPPTVELHEVPPQVRAWFPLAAVMNCRLCPLGGDTPP